MLKVVAWFVAANYLGNWKCISVLKGDGTPGEGHAAVAQNSASSSTPASNGNASGSSSGIVRYKGKTLTGTSQVVWH